MFWNRDEWSSSLSLPNGEATSLLEVKLLTPETNFNLPSYQILPSSGVVERTSSRSSTVGCFTVAGDLLMLSFSGKCGQFKDFCWTSLINEEVGSLNKKNLTNLL